MSPLSITVEQVIARIASRSHGVVTRDELLRAGLGADAIRRRVRSGALIRVHPGVYRAGHRAPSVEATYLAAVKACRAGARLSGLAAAHLLGLVRGPAPAPEVTAPRPSQPRGRGPLRDDPKHVEAILRRRRTAPGARRLRAVLHGDARLLLSGLERRFLELLRAAGLPREREAYARGDEFRRSTRDDVFETPGVVLREMSGLLTATPPPTAR